MPKTPPPSPPSSPSSDRFDRDTHVEPLGDGRYAANVDPGWSILGNPNGGYITAILLRALEARVGDPERSPRTLTTHFTAAPAPGPIEIETTVERSGRSMTTVTARLLQDGRLMALSIGAFSLARESLEFAHARMPEVPGPDRLPRSRRVIELAQRYEVHYADGAGPEPPAERPWVAGWIRPAEPRALDPALLAAYSDALVPPVLAWRDGGPAAGPFPTVELTIHFRAPLPRNETGPGDFCLAAFGSRTAHQGFVEEDGEIWSRDGVLLAQSRQLAILVGRGMAPPPAGD